MDILEILGLAVGLSMDAFAVAICKGLAIKKAEAKHYIIIGAWFGGFQFLMPVLGFLLGTVFVSYIEAVDHWVAFALLAVIGGNMIRESFSKKEENESASLAFLGMLVLALATSIDALAVGITFSFGMDFPMALLSSGIIGVTTFALSAVGVKIGTVFGTKYKSKAELVGGIILILIGTKILIEGLVTT